MAMPSASSVEAAIAHLQRAKKVIVLSGAGMSTAAGIPDFRSPGGLYGTTSKLLDSFTYLEHGAKSAAWQRRQLENDIRSALTLEFFSKLEVLALYAFLYLGLQLWRTFYNVIDRTPQLGQTRL